MTSTALTTPSAVSARTADAAPTASAAAVARALAASTVLAAAVTEAFTATVRACGIRLALDAPAGHGGTPVAFGACAVSIVLCMIVGAALVYGVRRRARNARAAFVRSAIALTALSLAAPLLEPSTSAGTRLTLIAAHLLAAAVIVPVVARRL